METDRGRDIDIIRQNAVSGIGHADSGKSGHRHGETGKHSLHL
jgi:hypothetical protein